MGFGYFGYLVISLCDTFLVTNVSQPKFLFYGSYCCCNKGLSRSEVIVVGAISFFVYWQA